MGSQKENAQEWLWLLQDHFDLLETDQTRLADNKKIGLAIGYLRENALHTYHRAKINGRWTISRSL
jgi:hypothetical protein